MENRPRAFAKVPITSRFIDIRQLFLIIEWQSELHRSKNTAIAMPLKINAKILQRLHLNSMLTKLTIDRWRGARSVPRIIERFH